MPVKSSSRRKARKTQALALVEPAHAIAREMSSRDVRGGAEPPPSAVGVRVPRQARRKAWRKWDVSNDGELGLNSKECMKESCSCPRADETQDWRRCTRGPSLSARGPQQMLSRSMSWLTQDFPDLQHQGRGPESTGIQSGMLCPLEGLKRIPKQLSVATPNGVT